MPDPTVVVSDTPPPTVVCRSAVEASVCEELLRLVRQGKVPLAIIFRDARGAVEVHARSREFHSAAHAHQVMQEASVKLTSAMMGRRGIRREGDLP